PGGSRALEIADAGAGSGVATLDLDNGSFPAFDTTQPGQELIRMKVDFAVTTMVSGSGSASVPRILFRNTADVDFGLTLGLGRTSSNNVILYAAPGDNATANNGNRIVLRNYGPYDSTSGNQTANDTN